MPAAARSPCRGSLGVWPASARRRYASTVLADRKLSEAWKAICPLAAESRTATRTGSALGPGWSWSGARYARARTGARTAVRRRGPQRRRTGVVSQHVGAETRWLRAPPRHGFKKPERHQPVAGLHHPADPGHVEPDHIPNLRPLLCHACLRKSPGSCPIAGCWCNGRPGASPSRAQRLLAIRPTGRHVPARAGPAGEKPLAHRTRLPRTQNRPRPRPLRRPILDRLAPPLTLATTAQLFLTQLRLTNPKAAGQP